LTSTVIIEAYVRFQRSYLAALCHYALCHMDNYFLYFYILNVTMILRHLIYNFILS